MDVLDFYYRAYNDVVKRGYGAEIDYIDAIKPIHEQNPHTFFLEYVWVVLNAGMKEQVARKIYEQYIENFDVSLIRHPSKHSAIKEMIDVYHVKFAEMMRVQDKIAYLEKLAWIGPITKYHLARNIGIDTVKPDRHLVRLAEMFVFDTPMSMCEHIHEDSGAKLGTIDVVLWRYCNLHPRFQR